MTANAWIYIITRPHFFALKKKVLIIEALQLYILYCSCANAIFDIGMVSHATKCSFCSKFSAVFIRIK